DFQHTGDVHRKQVDPGTVEQQRLRSVTIPILVCECDLGGKSVQGFPPLAKKEETPGSGELAQPMREAQIRIVPALADQYCDALARIRLSRTVLGRDPSYEIRFDRVEGDEVATAGVANLFERLAAGVRILLIPPAGPDAPDEAAGTRSSASQRIA